MEVSCAIHLFLLRAYIHVHVSKYDIKFFSFCIYSFRNRFLGHTISSGREDCSASNMVNAYICMYVCVYVCVHVHVCMYMCVCMCVSMYV